MEVEAAAESGLISPATSRDVEMRGQILDGRPKSQWHGRHDIRVGGHAPSMKAKRRAGVRGAAWVGVQSPAGRELAHGLMLSGWGRRRVDVRW